MTSPGPTDAPSRRRRWWPWLVAALLIVVVWAAAAALLLLRVDRHERDGVAAVSAAQATLNASTITDPRSPDVLAPVVADFGAAHRELDNPLLLPLRVLPVAGRQLHAVRNLTAAAQQVGTIGETAIAQARAALQAPHATGPERVAAIAALAKAASEADGRLAAVSLGSRTALIGFVQRRYDDFARRLDKVRVGVHKGAVAATATATLLRGPSQLLLLAGNNAEMRNGSGMFLSATQVDVNDGKVTIGQVFDTGDLLLPAGAVPLPSGYAAVWGPYVANEEWRNLGMSARFDETAALAAKMWKARSGQDVDGVLAIDVAGVRALLAGTGPVNATGTVVNADDVVQYLMHDQYLGPSDVSAITQARHDRLGRIADAVVQAIQRGAFDTAAVAKQLPTVVAGRHLMLWSPQPATEAVWQVAGVGGVPASDSLLAAVQNLGANKLDQFLSVTTDVRIVPGPTSQVTAVLHLHNSTPLGQPSYIAGAGTTGVPPSTYLALVTLTMPGDAGQVLVDGKPFANDSGLDGPTRVVGTLRDIAPGGDLTVTISFTLPGPHGALQLESSARVPSATISVETPTTSVTEPDDQRPHVSW